MNIIDIRNVNAALSRFFRLLDDPARARETSSRAGPVRYLVEPTTTLYARPEERVLFSAVRDANPFFHLYEALWMLAGRNVVADLTRYNARMADFSDDGKTLNAAYGYRWRRHFGYDQLSAVIHELRAKPDSRRCVITMWDGGDRAERGDAYVGDLLFGIAGGKDIPCNLQVILSAAGGVLDMTVTNRSNDAVWGAYGANVVQFSTLQEFLAGAIGIPLGRYWQVSNNLHVYRDREDVKVLTEASRSGHTLYDDRYSKTARPVRLVDPGLPWQTVLSCIEEFVNDPTSPSATRDDQPYFISHVAAPMFQAHKTWKETGDYPAELLRGNIDWHVAGREWLDRRIAARRAKEHAA